TLRRALLAVAFLLVCFTLARPQPATPRKAPAPDSISFRVIFGYRRAHTMTYDGSVTAHGGRLLRVEPWHFFGQDRITGPDSWKLEIKRGVIENQPDRPVAVADGAVPPANLVPAGLIVSVDAT